MVEDKTITNCPNCNQHIDYLNTEQSGVKTYICWIGIDGKLCMEEEYFYPDCNTITEYTCPNCEKVLANSLEEATKLLEGAFDVD